MLKWIRNVAVIALLALVAACDTTTQKMQSKGGDYEVFVVIPRHQWEGSLGDTLRAIMLEPVPMLNQKEPSFDLVTIPPSAYGRMMHQHKNVLFVKIDTAYREPNLTAEYDRYAAPQILVSLTAANEQQATAYIWEHKYELKTIFELAERERVLSSSKKNNNEAISTQIKQMFNMNMNIPKGYKIRNSKDNFMWISFELRQASQGMLIYSYPYSGKANFSLDSLVARRNQFSAFIPGPVDGSFMTTSDIEPDLEHIRIGGRYWAKMRGFWDVQGDFMGGPFISYSTIDIENRRVVTIDLYVFSPKKHKRNYLRGVENLVYSVKFDGQDQTQEQAPEQTQAQEQIEKPQ